MKIMFGIIAVGGVALVLQGCGGGGGGDSTTIQTTVKPTTPTTTTTTTLPMRTKPMTPNEAAKYLNDLYLAFNQSTWQSKLGITVSMAANNTGFFANIFCSHFYNPAYHSYGKCWQGGTDCRMSASLMNHAWMIDNVTKAIASFGSRRVGYVFNQTMVETKWGKCSYIWDGATGHRYNRGCGDGAPSTKCGAGEDNAYNNQCDGHTCTPADDAVKRAICTEAGGTRPVPQDHIGYPQALFPGPSFGYYGQDDYKFGTDYTRAMAKARMRYNYGADEEGNNTAKNTEVILDEQLLMPDIWENPITAIPAIIYTQSTNQGEANRVLATTVRDDLCAVFGCEKNGGGKIPLVKVDDTRYWSTGPFRAGEASDDDSTITV